MVNPRANKIFTDLIFQAFLVILTPMLLDKQNYTTCQFVLTSDVMKYLIRNLSLESYFFFVIEKT